MTSNAAAPARQSALAYLARGWSVIPLRPGEKRPLVRWEQYQKRPPSADELSGWFTAWPKANVGIVTGSVSGLVVLDIDPAHGGVEAGQRNNTIASLTGHLLWHGVDPTVALEPMLAWNRARCRPPLGDEEVAQTVRSIAHRHQQHAGDEES